MPSPDEKRELTPDTMVDVGHEALLRQWTQLSDSTIDPVTREPNGWLLREVEDGQRWRFLALQAQDFKRNPSATLSPAQTAVYERWWRAHDNPVWVKRHARQPKEAANEYAEVKELWEASKRSAKQELTQQAVLRSLVPLLVAVGLVLSGIFLGIYELIDAGAGTFGALLLVIIMSLDVNKVDRTGKWWVIVAGTGAAALIGMATGWVARRAFDAGTGAAAYIAVMSGFTVVQLTLQSLLARARKIERAPTGPTR
jgi:hypothetical protein